MTHHTLKIVFCCLAVSMVSTASAAEPAGPPAQTMDLIFFTSNGKIGAVNPDGTGKRAFDFSHMNQMSWQPLAPMPDGYRIVFWSREYPKNPNASFYDKDGLKYAPTHLWLYDMFDRTFDEIKLPPLTTVNGALPEKKRLLVTGEPEGGDNTKILTCNYEDIFSGQ